MNSISCKQKIQLMFFPARHIGGFHECSACKAFGMSSFLECLHLTSLEVIITDDASLKQQHLIIPFSGLGLTCAKDA